MKRTDIMMKDVFISWTGKDRELKDIIVQFLNSNGISCLESDESCSGDFREWSKEAVSACSVFLLILTENTLKSKYVPIEIEELKKLDDWENRVVPVCMNMELYQKHSWGLHESESAVVLGDQLPANEHLSAILHKTIDLLIHRQYAIYCNQSNKEYVTLTPLLGTNKIAAKQYSYDSLYISRSVTELDDQGQHIETIESPNELIKADDILFIYGPAGSGKTQYIHQITNCTDDNDLVISLPCAKMAQSSEDLLSCIYHEFERIAGIRTFYSVDNFKRLLNVKHLVLILDGMDEIATQTGTQKFVNKVEKFYASNSKNVTLIFTSRNADDANTIALEGKKPRRFVLNKLTDSQVSKLSENLFLLFGSADHNNGFYIKLNDLDEEIRSNPLLLSQLAIIYQNTGEIPQSVIGIYDAISKITFNIDLSTEFDSVPANYKEMLELELSSILKSFSQERYKLLSQGKNIEITKIFSKILKEKYAGESKERAEFLVEYLQNRSILIDGEFYHKMFLEYFTAVAYYEQAFDDYDEIENVNILNELFAHYDDAYWSAVIKLFLVKADSCIDERTTEELYDSILKNKEIIEYTLLFDTCRDLIRHKERAQLVLVCDILSKSVDGTYPPYGHLFWYVPEYELYETAVLSAEKLLGDAKALALVRDVCFIFGQFYSAKDITKTVNHRILFNRASKDLSGVRKALCELFYTETTDYTGGTNIYPRCFNVAEARSLLDNNYGTIGRYLIPFEDELGLYNHSMLNFVSNELCGLISFPYYVNQLEKNMNDNPIAKVRGLILSPSEQTEMRYIHFDRISLKKLYLPENVFSPSFNYDNHWYDYLFLIDYIYCPKKPSDFFDDDDGIYYSPIKNADILPSNITKIPSSYFEGRADLLSYSIPDNITEIGTSAFADCSGLKTVKIPEGVTKIGDYAFKGCSELKIVEIPSTVISIGTGAFALCHSLEQVIFHRNSSLEVIYDKAFSRCSKIEFLLFPDSLCSIGEDAFFDCTALKKLHLPLSDDKAYSYSLSEKNIFPHMLIHRYAFSNCISLIDVRLPANLQVFDSRVFVDCVNLRNLYFPRGCTIKVMTDKQDFLMIDLHFPNGIADEKKLFLYGANLSYMYTDIYRDSNSALIIYRIHNEIKNAFLSMRKQNMATQLYSTSNDKSEQSYAVSETETVHVSGMEKYTNTQKIITATIGDDVSDISPRIFMNCCDLKQVHFPRELICIPKEAFKNCRSLCEFKTNGTLFSNGQLILPSLFHIDEGAFEGCELIREVRLTEPLYKIENNAFKGCVALNVVVLPKSLRYLGDDSFSDCPNLTSVTLSKNFRNDIDRVFGNIDDSIIKWIN